MHGLESAILAGAMVLFQARVASIVKELTHLYQTKGKMQSQSSNIEEIPLLIAQVDAVQSEDSGDFHYRTYAPGIGMANCDGAYTVSCTNLHRLKFEIMRLADILIINNVCDEDILPVIRNREAAGKLTIYEISDDLSDIPPAYGHIRDVYLRSKNLLLIKRLANYCDALQFCSHGLKRKFAYLNDTSAVFPNQMLEIPPERKTGPSKNVTVGWGGSLGHLKDMERVSKPLIEWIMSRENVRLHLMCPDEIWALFDRLPGDRISRSATGSLNDYYRFVSQLDIGIAPLEDTDFNCSRSDVKFLEYAAHTVAPVVQAKGPYPMSVQNGKTGFLFNSTDELIAILDRLACDASARTGLAAAAHRYVLLERNQLERGRDRVQFYRSLLAAAGWKASPGGACAAETFERLCNSAGAKKTGRNVYLAATRYEQLLLGGAAALQADKSRAKEIFQEAIRIVPSSYMPYLMGAFVSDDKVGSLRNAIARNPNSIAARLSLGTVYGGMGMSREAIEAFKTAAGIFPDYEQPYIQCANYFNSIGMTEKGIELLKKAIAVIPKAIRDHRDGDGPGMNQVKKLTNYGLDNLQSSSEWP
jgi:tetratricopeptide (TPR) repeat protein